MNPGIRKIIVVILSVFGVYLGIQYLLPLVLPFLLGAALALAAEPLVGFLCEKVRLPRPVSAGVGVTAAFALLTLAVVTLCALAVRQLQSLTAMLPEVYEMALAGMDSLSGWLMGFAQRAPGALRTMLTENVTDFFSGGAALLERVGRWLVNLATGLLGRLPDSALLLGTGIISSFMISAKLPKLKAWLRSRVPMERLKPALAAMGRMKGALGGWLKAQLKLCGITLAVTAVGLLALRVPHGLFWAVLIGFVDALPVLGAGMALVPWSLVAFLQGDRVLAFGLLGIYGVIALLRSILEPRLVGRQLGLDPLVTLIALYAGYRLWGFGGMILAPMLAVTARQLAGTGKSGEG